jgi:hypothetical protein
LQRIFSRINYKGEQCAINGENRSYEAIQMLKYCDKMNREKQSKIHRNVIEGNM